MAIRVLLADDHRLFREGLKALLGSLPDVEVVGEADNGRRAVELAEQTKPDVVVMDVTMPELNGEEAARRILRAFQAVRVVALSMHSDRRFVSRMLGAGCSAYVLKEAAFEELHRAVRAVAAGGKYLSSSLAGEGFAAAEHEAAPLSSREREVLQLLAEGKSTRETAARLFVSVKTVETHRQHVMRKLDLHTVAELTRYAIREGIVAAES